LDIFRLGPLILEDLNKGSHFYPAQFYPALFDPGNLREISYNYDGFGEPEVMTRWAFCRPLREVLPRLELLGYSLEKILPYWEQFNTELNKRTVEIFGWRRPTFASIASVLKTVDVYRLDSNPIDIRADVPWLEISQTAVEASNEQLDEANLKAASRSSKRDFEEAEPLLMLRMLAENEANLDLEVIWESEDEVVNPEEYCGIPKSRRFLVVTEGSSDSAIISRSLELLRPEIRDFFDFIDMSQNYPFTGSGSLTSFCKGLDKIGILNNVVAVFDNDTEGNVGFQNVERVISTPTLRVMTLPSLPEFEQFPVVGPDGETTASINGFAAAIECFLDIGNAEDSVLPRVRWTSYNRTTRTYQGELDDKDRYTKRFFERAHRDANYDFSKLRVVVESLERVCADIAATTYIRDNFIDQ
jgi:hypothetical protein